MRGSAEESILYCRAVLREASSNLGHTPALSPPPTFSSHTESGITPDHLTHTPVHACNYWPRKESGSEWETCIISETVYLGKCRCIRRESCSRCESRREGAVVSTVDDPFLSHPTLQIQCLSCHPPFCNLIRSFPLLDSVCAVRDSACST